MLRENTAVAEYNSSEVFGDLELPKRFREGINVVLLAPFMEPVHRNTTGGIERVVHDQAAFLGQLKGRFPECNINVTVIASGDSKIENVSVEPGVKQSHGLSNENHIRDAFFDDLHLLNKLREVLEHLKGTVIIHSHAHRPLIEFLELPDNAIRTATMHNKYFLDPVGDPLALRQLVRTTPAIISHFLQNALFPDRPDFGKVVWNGVQFPDSNGIVTEREDFLFCLGRISEKKGTDLAIDVAEHARMNIVIAGTIDAPDAQFFEEKILPRINGTTVRYVGAVYGETKDYYLKNAKALVVPSRWEEPFGLVVVEALREGTPVCTLRRGAFPEILEAVKGERGSGYLFDAPEDAAEHLRELGELNSPTEISKLAFRHFSAEAMGRRYLDFYQQLLETNKC